MFTGHGHGCVRKKWTQVSSRLGDALTGGRLWSVRGPLWESTIQRHYGEAGIDQIVPEGVP